MKLQRVLPPKLRSGQSNSYYILSESWYCVHSRGQKKYFCVEKWRGITVLLLQQIYFRPSDQHSSVAFCACVWKNGASDLRGGASRAIGDYSTLLYITITAARQLVVLLCCLKIYFVKSPILEQNWISTTLLLTLHTMWCKIIFYHFIIFNLGEFILFLRYYVLSVCNLLGPVLSVIWL